MFKWFQKYRELLLYFVFGGLSFLVNLVTFICFNKGMGMDELTANGFSWVLTVLFVFFTNRIWVFQAPTETHGQFFIQLGVFFAGRMATLILEEGILLLFVKFLNFDSIQVKVAAQIIVILSNYVISKWVVFGESKEHFLKPAKKWLKKTFRDMEKQEHKKKIIKKIFFAIIVCLTLFRIYLGIKTPVFLQADAGYDDFLYIQYSINMLHGKWLGDFSTLVLLKTASPAFLLAINYVLGISYPVSLVISYIIAVFLFSLAMQRLVNSKKFAMALYIFLLYSPGMFHEENVQKVYRGGYIIIFTLLVFAAVIGQYTARKNEQKREFSLWIALSCVSLPIFYYLKEDSVWILPFVCGGLAITIVDLWRGKHTLKQWRIAVVMLPLLTLACVTIGYKMLNYHYYGEYTITDRGGTYCKELLSDLLRVDDGREDKKPSVWVTRNMIQTAAKHSEDLMELLPYVEQSWNQWFGEGNEASGDFYIWAFRDAVQLSGVYEKGGAYVNSYYQEIHKDLQKAYESGNLKEKKGKIYISSTVHGFTVQEMLEYYREQFPKVVKLMMTYQENSTTCQEARGTYENLALMSNITGVHFRWSETSSTYYRMDEIIVSIENHIVHFYQKIGGTVFLVGVLGIAGMFVSVCIQIVKRKYSETGILFVTLGMGCSFVILILAVTWFCNFLSDRKIYDYLCAVIPLMEALEIVGAYYFYKMIRKIEKGIFKLWENE